MVTTTDNLPLSTLSHRQDLLLLKIYAVYRTTLSVILLLSFSLIDAKQPLVGEVKPLLFGYTAAIYVVINLVTLFFLLPRQQPLGPSALFVYFFIDLLALLLLTDANGGITSGLGILLIIIIAAASIMLSVQLAYLLTAMASLFVIADTFRLISQRHLELDSLLPAGIMGMVFFATTFLIQTLAERIRLSQQIAARSVADASNLQRLNTMIVERMRTGIIVCSEQGHIKLANQSARELLNDAELMAGEEKMLPESLREKLQQWRDSPQFITRPFQATVTGPELQASFSALESHGQGDILIFLEDNRQLSQRAQEMKLASLGRFTASIAHEIRNPLGAISHAAQLLNESDNLDKADERLATIIHSPLPADEQYY